MQRFLLLISLSSFTLLFQACTDNESTKVIDSLSLQTSQPDTLKPEPVPAIHVEATVFEATDSTGKKTGWGYDLSVDGKRVIHQPIIPGRSGNAGFATEADAKKTGDYAAKKFMDTGRFPSISQEELDSLGIK